MKLIDRDLFLESIKLTPQFDCISELLEIYIAHFPIAYDVDKVVEQLEDKSTEHAINGQQFDTDGWLSHASIEYSKRDAFDKAVDIVKAGGLQ